MSLPNFPAFDFHRYSSNGMSISRGGANRFDEDGKPCIKIYAEPVLTVQDALLFGRALTTWAEAHLTKKQEDFAVKLDQLLSTRAR